MAKPVGTYQSKFSDFSVILVFMALFIIGLSFVPLLNVKLKPSETLPNMRVVYKWGNASARVIEQKVTSQLEGVLSSVSSLKGITSRSSKGYGQVNLSFKKNADMDMLRFEVATLIRRVYPLLPYGVSYPQVYLGGGGGGKQTLLSYRLTASATPYFIEEYANKQLVPKLSNCKGINQVTVYGATQFEWKIIFNSKLLDQTQISPNELRQAINNYFSSAILGISEILQLEKAEKLEMRVVLKNSLSDSLNWSKIPIKKVGARILFLSDIASVKYQEKPPTSYYRINGLNTVNLVIYTNEDANSIISAGDVKETIEKLRRNLPRGYGILLSYDASEFVQKEISKISLRSALSLFIILLFVIIVTRKIRYVVLITLSLLINLVIAVVLYYLLKLEIHLYSLAGITVSFGIIIDNSVVMIDHYRHHGNRNVFIAIFAATLTTIGALSVVFFLSNRQQLNLLDFVWVVMVNLGVSVLIALFFIPSFINLFPLTKAKRRGLMRKKRLIVRFNSSYLRLIGFSKRYKWAYIVVMLLGFGIPVHLLPNTIKDKDNFWVSLYNKTLGAENFVMSVKPLLKNILGGSLRLFSENVFEKSFYSEPEKTRLHAKGSMPEGCTVQQLNEVVKDMENYLLQFDKIELFETSITDYRNAYITINFIASEEDGTFPFVLKDMMTSKAISLGGMDWNIYGVGRGFSNALRSGYKSNQIALEGYNYDQLYAFARQLADSLQQNTRVNNLEIAGRISRNTELLNEYYFNLNLEAFTMNDLSLREFYGYLNDQTYSTQLNPVYDGKKVVNVSLESDRASTFNSWWLKNDLIDFDNTKIKVSYLGEVSKKKSGNSIYKNNQQYKLIVAWDFIGSHQLSEIVTKEHIEMMNNILPMGYKVWKNQRAGWNKRDTKQYYLIFLVIAIIYLISSVLLESFTQPLAVIGLIPISFIGIFLTFYLFDINFDQGGFASFIFLAGITVNSGLYIINDFNNLKKMRPGLGSYSLYLKAFNQKIIPIFLTILSSIFGLLPFMIGGQKEVFWFAFAAGVIGGLVFSMLAIFIYFPLFFKFKKV